MSKLILSVDGVEMSEHLLVKPKTLIGRKKDSDIHIDDEHLSGEHALIMQEGEEFYVVDLDSTNGTMVRGKPVQRYLLKHNDVIELGDYGLRFFSKDHYSSTDFPFSRMAPQNSKKS